MRILQFGCKEGFKFVIPCALRRRKGQHGNTKPFLKQFMIDFLLLGLRDIHHIQQQYGGFIQCGKFCHHIHAPFQL